MTIKLIQIFDNLPPSPAHGVTFLYVTDPEKKGEHKFRSYANAGFCSKMTLEVTNISMTQEFLNNYLPGLDFNMQETILAIYADAACVSSIDIALLVSMIVPDVNVETSDGRKIRSFAIRGHKQLEVPKIQHG